MSSITSSGVGAISIMIPARGTTSSKNSSTSDIKSSMGNSTSSPSSNANTNSSASTSSSGSTSSTGSMSCITSSSVSSSRTNQGCRTRMRSSTTSKSSLREKLCQRLLKCAEFTAVFLSPFEISLPKRLLLDNALSTYYRTRLQMKWSSACWRHTQIPCYERGNEVQHANKKEKAERECYRRAQAVSKTEINSANRIEALYALAYGFNGYMQLEPIRQHYIEQTQNSVNCDYATGCGAQIQMLTGFMSPEGKGQGPDSA
nr:uncharacterized protein LOC113817384 [Penaeus vannamei]